MIDVALDTRATSHMSVGVKAYVRELAERLPRVAPDLRLAHFGAGDNFDWAEQAVMPAWIARARPRLVHVPSPYVPALLPARSVVTVHDVTELRFPQYAKRTVAPYYAWIVAPVLRRARRVICMTERTADEIVRLLGVARERLRIVPLGVGEAFLAPGEPAPRVPPYALYVGNHRPHKDLATLLAAWQRLPARVALDLHLTGADDLDAARYAREGGRIVFLGTPDETALIAAYRGARAYVHPALNEGFGLPLLEAAALGVAVIACVESIPDVLAADALSFAPRDVAALTALLTAAAGDAGAMRERGARLAATARAYSWDRCAAATADVYREALT